MEGALMAPPHSRRAFLTGTVGAGIGLAGCGSSSSVEGLRTPTFESVVSGVTVESQEIVLSLSSSDVTEAVLIGPDGTAFDSQTVETGERTVRFQIIELDLSLSRYSHYTPGMYEIFVVADDEEFSQSLSLVPELQITAVEQYRDGERDIDLSRLAFTVENVGTGPTWVYDFAFEGAPNYTANGTLSDNYEILYLQLPTTADDAILSPSEAQRYVTSAWPLALPEDSDGCVGGELRFLTQIGVADGNHLSTELIADFSGESYTVGIAEEVVCTDVSVSLAGSTDAN
jgi:hypothetical protein